MPIRLLPNCNCERDFGEEYYAPPTLFTFKNLNESLSLNTQCLHSRNILATEHVRYTSSETSFGQYPDRHENNMAIISL